MGNYFSAAKNENKSVEIDNINATEKKDEGASVESVSQESAPIEHQDLSGILSLDDKIEETAPSTIMDAVKNDITSEAETRVETDGKIESISEPLSVEESKTDISQEMATQSSQQSKHKKKRRRLN